MESAVADIARAEAAVKVADAAVQYTRTLAAYRTISAPYDGTITKRMIDHGAFVPPAEGNSAAMPLFEITRTDRVRVRVNVPSGMVSRIAVGQPAAFHSIGGMPGRRFEGTITRSAGVLDRDRSMPIEVHFTNPVTEVVTGDKVFLSPGLFGTLEVTAREWNADDPLPVVPATAVATEDDRSFVVVISASGQPERRYVDIVFNDAINAGIGRGLSVGESIASSPE